MNIIDLKGVGEKKAALYKKLGIETVERLTEYYPRGYVDFTEPERICDAKIGEVCVIRAAVTHKTYPSNYGGRVLVFRALLTDGFGEITAVFFNAKFTFDQLQLNKEYLFCGKIAGDAFNLEITSPQFVQPGEIGLLPKYPLTKGLSNSSVSKDVKTSLEMIRRAETLPPEIINKYGLMGADDAMRKIHFPKTREEYESARKRLVFEELLTLKLGLSQLKNRGRTLSGAVMADVDMNVFYNSLPFTPTNAQLNAVNDCINDMKRMYPMNRLIQGDVGSGKTMVAAAAAYWDNARAAFGKCEGGGEKARPRGGAKR